MLDRKDLRKLAWERLKDARTLLKEKRYDGAVYLGGYVVEIALKARICKTLKWNHFPQTRNEFQGLSSFKTHSLDILLRLSGAEGNVKGTFLAEWSAVASWDPEARYSPIGTATKADAELLIESAEAILRAL